MDQSIKLNVEKAFRFHQVFGNEPLRAGDALFYRPKPFVYQMVPADTDKNIAKDVVPEVFASVKNTLGVRYFQRAVIDRGGVISMLLCTPPYDFSSIESKARNQTRRGLERVVCKCVFWKDCDEDELFCVYEDNAMRLSLFKNRKALLQRWEKWKKVLAESDLLDIWVAKKNERIVAFILVAPFYQHGGEILLHRSLRSALKDYPNNALLYVLLNYYFDRGWEYVSYGLRSWQDADSGLLHFKHNMGFRDLFWEQRFKISPYLGGFSLSVHRLKKIYKMLRK